MFSLRPISVRLLPLPLYEDCVCSCLLKMTLLNLIISFLSYVISIHFIKVFLLLWYTCFICLLGYHIPLVLLKTPWLLLLNLSWYISFLPISIIGIFQGSVLDYLLYPHYLHSFMALNTFKMLMTLKFISWLQTTLLNLRFVYLFAYPVFPLESLLYISNSACLKWDVALPFQICPPIPAPPTYVAFLFSVVGSFKLLRPETLESRFCWAHIPHLFFPLGSRWLYL